MAKDMKQEVKQEPEPFFPNRPKEGPETWRFRSTKPSIKVMLKQAVSPAAVKNCPSLANEVGPGAWAKFNKHEWETTNPTHAEIIRRSYSFQAQTITEVK